MDRVHFTQELYAAGLSSVAELMQGRDGPAVRAPTPCWSDGPADACGSRRSPTMRTAATGRPVAAARVEGAQ
nr:hypothetical protein C5F59_09430 [Streptomyces sp. QL37]